MSGLVSTSHINLNYSLPLQIIITIKFLVCNSARNYLKNFRLSRHPNRLTHLYLSSHKTNKLEKEPSKKYIILAILQRKILILTLFHLQLSLQLSIVVLFCSCNSVCTMPARLQLNSTQCQLGSAHLVTSLAQVDVVGSAAWGRHGSAPSTRGQLGSARGLGFAQAARVRAIGSCSADCKDDNKGSNCDGMSKMAT